MVFPLSSASNLFFYLLIHIVSKRNTENFSQMKNLFCCKSSMFSSVFLRSFCAGTIVVDLVSIE